MSAGQMTRPTGPSNREDKHLRAHIDESLNKTNPSPTVDRPDRHARNVRDKLPLTYSATNASPSYKNWVVVVTPLVVIVDWKRRPLGS